MSPVWSRVERLSPELELSSFATGQDLVDEWFQTKAHAEQQANRCSTTVCIQDDGRIVAAFSMKQVIIESADLSNRMKPRNGEASTALLIAYMGVTTDLQGQGAGKALMRLTLETALEVHERSAFRLIVLDAVTDDLVRFYTQFGFKVTSRDRRLVMKVSEAKAIVGA